MEYFEGKAEKAAKAVLGAYHNASISLRPGLFPQLPSSMSSPCSTFCYRIHAILDRRLHGYQYSPRHLLYRVGTMPCAIQRDFPTQSYPMLSCPSLHLLPLSLLGTVNFDIDALASFILICSVPSPMTARGISNTRIRSSHTKRNYNHTTTQS